MQFAGFTGDDASRADFSSLSSGRDAPHHGRYAPDGQLRGDILADMPVVHSHRCLWFRLQ